MSTDKEFEISKIIEKLVTSGQKTLDVNLMKSLKKICKASNKFVDCAYYALMTQLRKEHSEIRFSCLLIINELFLRSSIFRKLLEADLEEFLELVAETDPENPLPLPRPAAKDLKLKGLEFMQDWTSKFGDKCTRLELALTFLKKCRKVDFNDMEARNVAQRERLRQEQERQERILNEKIIKVQKEMLEMSEEISNTILQMENCFKLLVPHPTEFFSPEDFTVHDPTPHSENDLVLKDENHHDQLKLDENELSSANDSLRHHGLHNMKKSITIEMKEDTEIDIKVNEDTQPIIENLEDLYKEMKTRFYPSVTKWLKILTKGSGCTDNLKKAIDLKQLIESSFEKYKELKIRPDTSNKDDEDDDDFVEVKEKEGYEAEAINEGRLPNTKSLPSQPSCSKTMTDVEKAFLWKLKHSEDDIKDPTSAASTLRKRAMKCKLQDKDFLFNVPEKKKDKNAELLEKAPVLPYDIDLYHWEDEKPVVPERVRFDSLHKFWESKDDEEENETLREVQVASLRTRKIDFSGKFEPVKWSCRAPLPSGKLCPRKDRYKCPFHGVIIKRDSSGKPVDAPESTAGPSTEASTSVPEWQDPELLRDIEAATGINLKIPQKRGKGKKKPQSKKKESGLTNIKKIQTSSKDRLSKKILKRYKHYAKKMDDIERKRFNDKFGDQWNYY